MPRSPVSLAQYTPILQENVPLALLKLERARPEQWCFVLAQRTPPSSGKRGFLIDRRDNAALSSCRVVVLAGGSLELSSGLLIYMDRVVLVRSVSRNI